MASSSRCPFLPDSIREKQRTFNIKKGSTRIQKGMSLKASLIATLQGNVDLAEAVKLPPGEDLNEWMAINVFLFYEVSTNIYKACSEICTETTCPKMTAGPTVTYAWADPRDKTAKPEEVPAPVYIDKMLEWAFDVISDPAIFPQDDDVKFPKTFKKTVGSLFKRIFRMYAHLFHSHFAKIKENGAEAHLNSSFKHFVLFALKFELIEEKEFVPLADLIAKLRAKTKA